MRNLFCTVSAILLMLSSCTMAPSESDALPDVQRFTTARKTGEPYIEYYFTPPKAKEFPILIICRGSASKDFLDNAFSMYRFFWLNYIKDLDVGFVMVEQWGMHEDEKKTDAKIFMKHYTRSQRLEDHKRVIENLKVTKPKGWNGKVIWLGGSEGGPLVTTLTTLYQDITLATIDWVGTVGCSWREHLWTFMKHADPSCKPEDYAAQMDAALENPTEDKYFADMTYKYHADALKLPEPDCSKIRTPLLVVAGDKDSIVTLNEAFVQKARAAGTPVTYWRVKEMGHDILSRPDMIIKSFDWMKTKIA